MVSTTKDGREDCVMLGTVLDARAAKVGTAITDITKGLPRQEGDGS